MLAAVLGDQRRKQFWDPPFSAIFVDRAVEGGGGWECAETAKTLRSVQEGFATAAALGRRV